MKNVLTTVAVALFAGMTIAPAAAESKGPVKWLVSSKPESTGDVCLLFSKKHADNIGAKVADIRIGPGEKDIKEVEYTKWQSGTCKPHKYGFKDAVSVYEGPESDILHLARK